MKKIESRPSAKLTLMPFLLIIIITMMRVTECKGQVFEKRDGSLVEVAKITASSDKSIYTDKGMLSIAGLKSARFKAFIEKEMSLYRKLKKGGVELVFERGEVPDITELDNSSEKSYKNFFVENQNLIWQKVYERPGMALDSISRMVYSNFKLDNCFELLSDSKEEILLQMNRKVFNVGGNYYYGRVIIEFKEEKYRITISGVKMDLGQNGMELMYLITGTPTGIVPNTHFPWEQSYLTDGKIRYKKNNLQSMSTLDDLFNKAFDYKLNTFKKDW